jgi:hypothetical protein
MQKIKSFSETGNELRLLLLKHLDVAKAISIHSQR